LCKQYKIGVFFLTLPKGQNKHWEMVKILIAKWEDIVEITKTERKPFAYRIRIVGKMEQM
jgi:hypothetical protein